MPAPLEVELVQRSTAPAGIPYNKQKNLLRHDFFYSCAYCTMSEAEAAAIRFTIDHYEPRTARPDLVDEYSNLMYCCDECNRLKGDRIPSDSARSAGVRFFRPDTDRHTEHFEVSGQRIQSATPIGDFTILAVGLNRNSLRRLRDIRRRLSQCEEQVSQGVRALRRFQIDQLPAGMKGQASRAIRRAATFGEKLQSDIDKLLRDAACSPLLGNDGDPPDVEADLERMEGLRRLGTLHPGNWRVRRTTA